MMRMDYKRRHILLVLCLSMLTFWLPSSVTAQTSGTLFRSADVVLQATDITDTGTTWPLSQGGITVHQPSGSLTTGMPTNGLIHLGGLTNQGIAVSSNSHLRIGGAAGEPVLGVGPTEDFHIRLLMKTPAANSLGDYLIYSDPSSGASILLFIEDVGIGKMFPLSSFGFRMPEGTYLLFEFGRYDQEFYIYANGQYRELFDDAYPIDFSATQGIIELFGDAGSGPAGELLYLSFSKGANAAWGSWRNHVADAEHLGLLRTNLAQQQMAFITHSAYAQVGPTLEDLATTSGFGFRTASQNLPGHPLFQQWANSGNAEWDARVQMPLAATSRNGGFDGMLAVEGIRVSENFIADPRDGFGQPNPNWSETHMGNFLTLLQANYTGPNQPQFYLADFHTYTNQGVPTAPNDLAQWRADNVADRTRWNNIAQHTADTHNTTIRLIKLEQVITELYDRMSAGHPSVPTSLTTFNPFILSDNIHLTSYPFDGYHDGVYLAALVIYRTVFSESVLGLPQQVLVEGEYITIDPTRAIFYQQIVEDVIAPLDSAGELTFTPQNTSSFHRVYLPMIVK